MCHVSALDTSMLNNDIFVYILIYFHNARDMFIKNGTAKFHVIGNWICSLIKFTLGYLLFKENCNTWFILHNLGPLFHNTSGRRCDNRNTCPKINIFV